MKKIAAASHASYLYPVDAQVFSAQSELLDHVCANDHPDVARYRKLLAAARAQRSE